MRDTMATKPMERAGSNRSTFMEITDIGRLLSNCEEDVGKGSGVISAALGIVEGRCDFGMLSRGDKSSCGALHDLVNVMRSLHPFTGHTAAMVLDASSSVI